MDDVMKKNIKIGAGVLLAAFCLIFIWECYLPKAFGEEVPSTFVVQKGMNAGKIASALEEASVIKSRFFFKMYATLFNLRTKLQAGRYALSPSMSTAAIAQKIASGDTIKVTITVIEGWDIKDIGELLESKKVATYEDFLAATKSSAADFAFLSDKPSKLNLEGYLFPDTYEIAGNETAEGLVNDMLENFDKKLTPDLRAEIKKQKKSIFQIVTMASMLEKEVQSAEDKKIVAGILWKRIAYGMPLQVDATVNYITGKDHPGALIKDTKIDSPYNTYKYYGLPLGPIANPGLDSILGAIYPTSSDYWYYLSTDTGETIFSKTLEEHNLAAAKYLR